MLVGAAAVVFGCGRDHDLGLSTTSSTTGDGGSGAAGTGSSSAATTGSGGAGPLDAGPSGPTALTIVNGINDYPAVRFCFLPAVEPWPASSSGMAFAASSVVAPIAVALPSGADVTPWVIAGDLAQTAGKTCPEILATAAGPSPPFVARALAVIPEAIFASDKSLLLVSTGCLGGAGHDDAVAATACGTGYTSTTPTAGITLVAMSRIESPAHVSLQVVSASAALPKCDVRLQPNLTSGSEVTLVGSLSPGAIGPSPPFATLTATEYGPLDGVKIATYPAGGLQSTSVVELGEVFAAGGVGASGFVDGASLVLVAVGSGPGLAADKYWHAFTYALVEADPG